MSPVVSEHRKQIDDLKKFKNDFRVSSLSADWLELKKENSNFYMTSSQNTVLTHTHSALSHMCRKLDFFVKIFIHMNVCIMYVGHEHF